jgi:hypothetical protein
MEFYELRLEGGSKKFSVRLTKRLRKLVLPGVRLPPEGCKLPLPQRGEAA